MDSAQAAVVARRELLPAAEGDAIGVAGGRDSLCFLLAISWIG